MSDYLFPVLGGGSITSRPGLRASPGGIGSTNHKGLDVAASTGTGVIAPIDGTVIFSGSRGGFGNFVEIAGSDGFTHRFAHLNTRNVIQGQTIRGGSMIGTVGSTGNSTGPHLHYEVRDKKGGIINPETLLGKGAKILKEKGKDVLDNAKDALLGSARAAAMTNPITGAAIGVTDALGLTSDCGIICQIQNWLKESGFFTRLALAILAFVIIAVALGLLGKGTIKEQVASIAKGK